MNINTTFISLDIINKTDSYNIWVDNEYNPSFLHILCFKHMITNPC